MDNNIGINGDNNMMFDYVIFHRNCPDGYTSFFLLWNAKRISNDAIIFPDIPASKEAPPGIKNKTVIIMDVAYKKTVLNEIFKEAKHVVFIDHHITIRNDVLEILSFYENRHVVIYDDKKSGATLTWKYFYPHEKTPWFVKYIEDQDIGRWSYKYTMPFNLALDVNYDMDLSLTTLRKWKKLFLKKEVKKLIKLGKIYTEYQDFLLDQYSKRYSLEGFPGEKIINDYPGAFKEIAQYKVAVSNGPCPNTSLLGKKIVDSGVCDFWIGYTIHLEKKEMVLSFRSSSVDVGEIAKIFGGGGHSKASSCVIPLRQYNITDLFIPESFPRNTYSKK